MFSETNREIFPYFDGIKDKFGDPLAIDERYTRAMAAHDSQAIDEGLTSKHPLAVMDATAKLLLAIQEAFRLAPFDEDTGVGLTRDEAMNLFVRFMEWRDQKKESGDAGVNTSQHMDTLTDLQPALTSNSVESSGTENEPRH